jgi:polyferredoxin
MDKMDYPSGLVRYTTEHELTGGKTHWLRGRIVGYATVLLIMTTAFGIALLNRSTFEVDVLRERGGLYQINSAGDIVNRYSLRILNKVQQPQTYTIEVDTDLPISINRAERLAEKLQSLPGERLDLPVTLETALESVSLPSTPVTIRLCEVNSGHCNAAATTFIGPVR